MSTTYTLTLTNGGQGSAPSFSWAKGKNKLDTAPTLNVNDTITIEATFGNYSSNIQDYQGLSVGAECFSTNNTTLGEAETKLEGELKLTYDSTIPQPNPFYAGTLKNITTEPAPGDNDIFTSATVNTTSVTRGDVERKITNQVVMTYNPSSTILHNLNAENSTYSVCLAADYGDPHEGGCNIPVKRKKKK
jgi:hypothetical protein